MVGAEGVEPSTFWSRTKRATRLRYAPKGVAKQAHKLAYQVAEVKAKDAPMQNYMTRSTMMSGSMDSRRMRSMPCFRVIVA